MVYVWQQAREEGQFARGQEIGWVEMIALHVDDLARKGRTAKHVYDTRKAEGNAAAWYGAQGILPAGVNRRNAREYLYAYKGQGVSDLSVRHRAVKLKALFQWAFAEEFYPKNLLICGAARRCWLRARHPPRFHLFSSGSGGCRMRQGESLDVVATAGCHIALADGGLGRATRQIQTLSFYASRFPGNAIFRMADGAAQGRHDFAAVPRARAGMSGMGDGAGGSSANTESLQAALDEIAAAGATRPGGNP